MSPFCVVWVLDLSYPQDFEDTTRIIWEGDCDALTGFVPHQGGT